MRLQYTKKEAMVKRFKDLKLEANQWIAAWKDLSKYINPTRGRFDDIANKGKMIDHKTILDGHATQASRILASGMQSGMTSPTRPWFKLGIEDDYLMTLPPVQQWLDEVTKSMLRICNGSNIYGVFYQMYEEIGDFGTAACIILEDLDDVIRGRSFTIGEYYLGINSKGVVDTFGRDIKMTVGQAVEMFGYANCSVSTQAKYNSNNVDDWISVYHLIEPNDSRIDGKGGLEGMAYRSLYWENNSGEEVLRMSGFEEFPVIAPRWDTITTDMVYGYGPGWHLLGNVKQLQKTQLDKLLAQEKSHNPPMQKDASVEGYVNLLPGGVTPTSTTLPNAGLRPAYQVNANLESFLELINSLRESINKDFFVDLFLMMINFDKSNMTATEVAERQQEKILMMGPVLEKLQKEMLEPFINRLYGIMERNLLLPTAPEEMEGMKVKIEYISILAQAQKAVGVDSISRVIGFLNGVTAIAPQAPDVINIDEAIREVAKMEGVPAKLLVEQSVVEQIREGRARQQQIQQQMAMAAQGAESARKLSQAKLDDDNALTRLTQVQGKQ
jgi:hypothetical protein